MRAMARSAAGDLRGGALALHARRPNDDVRVRIAPAQHFEDVAQGGAVERCHDADLAWEGRQRPLARVVEQAFGLEPLLELLEGELQRAEPMRLHVLADELIFALRFIDADAAARDHLRPSSGLNSQVAQRGPEHHARGPGRRRPSA